MLRNWVFGVGLAFGALAASTFTLLGPLAAAPKAAKDANAKKKISARIFKARAAGSRSARSAAIAGLAAATFAPRKGAPQLRTNSTPDYSLSSPTVNVTFTGRNWTAADKAAVADAVKKIVQSAYLSALKQPNYGSDGKAVWGVSSTSAVMLKLDQGGPGARYPSFTSLDAFFKASPLGNAKPNVINAVVADTKASDGALGYNYSRGKGTAGSYIYVGTRTLADGSFDKNAFTEVVSHELAEAMTAGVQITDPGNFGMGQQGNQIADNEPEDVGYYATLTGTTILVQAYWSAKDKVWLVPGGMR
jgi:hypothetical protein